MISKILPLVIALSLACGGDGDDTTDDLLPIVTGQRPDLQLLRVGETVVIELAITRSNGSPLEEFDWLPEISTLEPAAFDVTAETGPGLIRYTVTALEEGNLYGVGGISFNDDRNTITAGHFLNLKAWGSETTSLYAMHTQISLAVGEARPTAAFPISANPRTGVNASLTAFASELTYTSADTNIAEVNAHGVVTGVGVGNTTIQIAHGSAETSIPVSVSAEALTLPPTGAIDITGLVEVDFGRGARYSINDVMAVDSRGYPSFVGSVRPPALIDSGWGFGWPVVISWTGTGWGAEIAAHPAGTGIKPKLTIDENDARWVFYRGASFGAVADATPVLTRLDEEGADFTISSLPIEWASEFVKDADFSVEHGVFPRRDGGVWTLWGQFADVQEPNERLNQVIGRACVSRLYLAEATTQGREEHLVVDNEIEMTEPLDCAFPTGTDLLTLDPGSLAVLPGASGALPRVVAPRTWIGCPSAIDQEEAEATAGCNLPVAILENDGSSWGAIDMGGDIDFADFTLNYGYRFRQAQVSRDSETPYDDARLVLDYRDTGPFEDPNKLLVIDDDGHTEVVAAAKTAGAWSFRRQGHTYVGYNEHATLSRLTPEGETVRELYEENIRREGGDLEAWAVSKDHLYLFAWNVELGNDPHIYVLPMPGDMPDASDVDETTGARLFPNRVFGPVALFDNGRRFLVGLAGADVWRYLSSGIGQAFSATQLALNTPLFSNAAYLIRGVGQDLYTFAGGQMLRSTDDGTTWPTFGPADDPYDGWELTPAGRFVGLRRVGNWDVYEDDDVTDGFDPVLLVAQNVLPLSNLRPVIGEDGDIYLVGGTNGVVQMIRISGGVADAPIVMNIDSEIQCTSTSAVVNGDGDLLLSCFSTENRSNDFYLPQVATAHTLHRASSTGTVTMTNHGNMAHAGIANANYPAAQVERLANGNVVVGWTFEDRDNITRRVVVRASADHGLTWGPQTTVRPTGGLGQSLTAMIGDSSGGLLVTMNDNGSISGAGSGPSHVVRVTGLATE